MRLAVTNPLNQIIFILLPVHFELPISSLQECQCDSGVGSPSRHRGPTPCGPTDDWGSPRSGGGRSAARGHSAPNVTGSSHVVPAEE